MIDIIKVKEVVIASNKDWHNTYIVGKAVLDIILNNDITKVDIYTDDKTLKIEWVDSYIYTEDEYNSIDLSILTILYDWENIVDVHSAQEDVKNKKVRYLPNDSTIKAETIFNLLYWVSLLNKGKFWEDMWTIHGETMDAMINSIVELKETSYEDREIVLNHLYRIAELWWNAMADVIWFLSNFGLLEELLWIINKQWYIPHNFEDNPEWMREDGVNRVLTSKINVLREYNWNDPDIVFAILFYDVSKPINYQFIKTNDEKIDHYYGEYWLTNINLLDDLYGNIEVPYNKDRVHSIIFRPIHDINLLIKNWYEITKDIYDVWYAIAKAKLCESNAPVKTFLINEWLEKWYKDLVKQWEEEWQKLHTIKD